MGILRDIGAPGLIIIVLGALLIFGPKRLRATRAVSILMVEAGERASSLLVSYKDSWRDKEKTSPPIFIPFNAGSLKIKDNLF